MCVAMTAVLAGCGLVAGLGEFKDATGGAGGSGSTTTGSGAGGGTSHTGAGGSTTSDTAGAGGSGGVEMCGNGQVDAGEDCDGPSVEHGSCVACEAACDADFANCNDTWDDGCESDLTSSAENCGACGHTCLGASCSASLCAPEELASGEAGARSVQVAPEGVFWANNNSGEIRMRDAQGGVVTSIATGQLQPFDVAVLGSDVYFTNQGDGTFKRVSMSGGAPETVHTEAGYQARYVTADGPELYWVSWQGQGGKLHHHSAGGPGVDTFAISQVVSFGSFTNDGEHLYFGTTNWKVYRVPIALDPVQEILASTGAGQPRGMAVDADWLYYGVNNSTEGRVYKMAKFGGAPVLLLSGLGNSNPTLALRDGVLYVTADAIGEIIALSVADGSQKTIVKGMSGGSIAVDATHVYWTDPVSGGVWRAAR